MKYFFHPAAEAEHLESVAYFESKRPDLVLHTCLNLQTPWALLVIRHIATRLQTNLIVGESE